VRFTGPRAARVLGSRSLGPARTHTAATRTRATLLSSGTFPALAAPAPASSATASASAAIGRAPVDALVLTLATCFVRRGRITDRRRVHGSSLVRGSARAAPGLLAGRIPLRR
jgi:hypothetical protein